MLKMSRRGLPANEVEAASRVRPGALECQILGSHRQVAPIAGDPPERGMIRRILLACWILTLAVAPLGAAARCAAGQSRPLHLIRSGVREPIRGIDGVFRRILTPNRWRVAIPLVNPPADSTLVFSVGLDDVDVPGAVRLQVVLRSGSGKRFVIYRRDLDKPGWRDESVDLSGRDLSGASLIFLKERTAGGFKRLWSSYWGEPILVPARPQHRASVVLVSIDTLRADLLATYGPPAAMPALERLAKAGIVYTEAYSPSLWTFPSHYALLRGVFPGTLPGDSGAPPPALPAERPVALAEVLRDHGYLTAGFTGGGYVSPVFDFADGFDLYYAFRKPGGSESDCTADRFDGAQTFGRAEKWLRAHRTRPFFLFVHTYDAHDRCGFLVGSPDGVRRLDPKKRDEIITSYRKEIEHTDRLLGTLVETLAELKLEEDTLVIVTSDHGEELWEHGEAGHGCDNKPYRDLIHVPLVLRFPAKVAGGRRVETPTSLVGIAPAILELLGVPVPATMKDAPAIALAPPADANDPVYAHCGDLLAVRDGPYKLITSRGEAFRPELYDLQSDPLEKEPLPADRPAAARLRNLAARYWETYAKRPKPAGTGHKLDDATRERLRALGYDE
jgi:arylsulfatase A-like enzyme